MNLDDKIKNIEETLDVLKEDDCSLEEKYVYLRSAYDLTRRLMDETRLELDKERVAAIQNEKEKRRMGRILLGDRTDNIGVTHFKIIETMAGDAAVCTESASRYAILQKIMHQISELTKIL